MLDPQTRSHLDALLRAVRSRPSILPMTELAALHHTGVNFRIEDIRGDTVAYLTPRTDPRFDHLSPREREVATLAAAGFSNDQLAAALYISVGTVKDHMHAIFTKTGLSSRARVIAAWHGGLPNHEEPTKGSDP